jgi:hypothetical protein
MLSGWRWLNGSHRIDQARFQSRMLLQVEPLSLPAIRLTLVDRSEIGFLSPYTPLFSGTETNGSQVEFVPWRSQKEKALSLPLRVRMHPDVRARSSNQGTFTAGN